MCGIFGFVSQREGVATSIDLEAARRALHHRGPDDHGVWRGRAGDVYAGLVHTRLAILDLSPLGHQPMESHDGRYLVVFNGEIFNFADLRRELEAEGVRFRSTGDTEVLLEAYARWGEKIVVRLRGMYAFAIFDRHAGTLFLTRDRLGVKPLYFARLNGGGVAFSSEVRALMQAKAVARKLSLEAVHGYLAFGSVPDPLTIVEGVESLLPGATLTFREGELVRGRYWDIPLATPEEAPTLEEATAAVRAELRDAVRLRLVSDVPLGIFLSGGIDSSAIVALAAEVSNTPLHTFTVTLEDRALDEARYAEDVALRFGCAHHTLHLSAARAVAEIDDAVKALDQPSADGVNTYFVAKAARQGGMTVALSGLGGDELFAGYPNFRTIGRLARGLRFAEPVLSPGLASAIEKRVEKVSNRARKSASLLGSPEVRDIYAVLRGFFSPLQSERLAARPSPGAQARFVSAPPGFDEAVRHGRLDPVNAFGVLELGNYMRNTLLRDADVMSMAHALEVRVPLIDHQVVDVAMALPGALKLRRGLNKPLLVDAVPTLPRSAFSREKQGFTLPFDGWFRGPLKGWMEERLLSASARQLGVFQPDAVKEKWGAFVGGGNRVSHTRVWGLAALSAWCVTNGVSL